MAGKRTFWIVFSIVLVAAVAVSVWGEIAPKEPEKEYENIEDYLQEDNYPFNDPSFTEGTTTFTSADLTEKLRQVADAAGLSENSSLQISKEGSVTLRTAIVDVSALCEQFPQAKEYTSVISLVEDRQIVATFSFTEDPKGNVAYDITELSVSGVAVDGSMVKPYLASSKLFSALEKIPFSVLSFGKDRISFIGEVPQVLLG